MATIRAHTTIEQSRKLAEILPLESADMCYMYLGTEDKEYENIPICAPAMEGDLCAWSLAALLGVLPKGTNISTPDTLNKVRYSCWNDYDITYASNPVDACYEMIIHLHELKML